MNLILLFDSDFVDAGRVRLAGRRFEHAASVLDARHGDVLKVGRCNGKIGTGTVVRRDADAIELAVELAAPAPAPLPVTLLVALPRPQTLKKVVECSVAFGVKRLIFMQTSRVEKSYWQSPLLAEESLNRHVYLGLEQAGDTVMPTIEFKRRFNPFVEDELGALSAGTRRLLAHPGGVECPCGPGQPVTLAIGPEGGFIPYEIDMLTRAAFEVVSLGTRVLRVEYAVAAALGRHV